MEVGKETDAICARKFSFSYPDGPRVLDRIDWRVAQGAFVLIIGATGSGKTTLLRNLKPELAPAGVCDGSLCVLGDAVRSWEPGESAARIGYVAQSPENQMVCDEVAHEVAFGLENLGCAPGAMRRRVAEVAQFFGIGEWMHRAVADLSGGQKQLVNLAGVLVMQPRLLLLDEPTAQLDPVAEKNFLHELFRVNRELGVTVVVATHAPEAMAAYATCVFEVAAGKVSQADLREFAPSIACEGKDLASKAPSGHRSPLQLERRARALPLPLDSGGITGWRQGSTNNRKGVASSVPPEKPTEGALSLTDVFFRYAKGEPWVLRGLDFSARPGAVHAVVGGNGSGKSTLLRMAARALKQERGRVRNPWIGAQALLPQDPKALFVCDTVEEELMEWAHRCGYVRTHTLAQAERFGLKPLLARHPYDLSGGQKQLLALAKVLLTRPSLLLLDEPTKGLDAHAKLHVARALAACAHEGAAIVCATHDLSFVAAVADSVSMLFDGQLACTEPAAKFFENNLFYRPLRDAFTRLLEEES